MTAHRAPLITTAVAALLVVAPSLAWADDGTGCTILAQAAASGLAARVAADDQTIKPPQSVTKLTCLNNFFSGVGLNVLTNLLDPTSLLDSVEGKICALATSAWQSTIGSGAVRPDHHRLQRRLRRPRRRLVLSETQLSAAAAADRQHRHRPQRRLTSGHVPERRRLPPTGYTLPILVLNY